MTRNEKIWCYVVAISCFMAAAVFIWLLVGQLDDASSNNPEFHIPASLKILGCGVMTVLCGVYGICFIAVAHTKPTYYEYYEDKLCLN